MNFVPLQVNPLSVSCRDSKTLILIDQIMGLTHSQCWVGIKRAFLFCQPPPASPIQINQLMGCRATVLPFSAPRLPPWASSWILSALLNTIWESLLTRGLCRCKHSGRQHWRDCALSFPAPGAPLCEILFFSLLFSPKTPSAASLIGLC